MGGSRMGSNDVHTLRKHRAWINEVNGQQVGESHRTRKSAVAAGRDLAIQNLSEHLVHLSVRRRFALGFITAGLFLVPWALLLIDVDNGGWTLLDIAEASGLLVLGFALWRRHRPTILVAGVATAALLLLDACLDIAAASPGAYWTPIAMAVGAELPVAALCLLAAHRFGATQGVPARDQADAGRFTAPAAAAAEPARLRGVAP
jgi:hypothetical protein